MNYEEFIQGKSIADISTGIEIVKDLNPYLMDFQKDIVIWALRRGRSCLWADCGLGKTVMQLSWAEKVVEYTKGSVLILAPLAVSNQTIGEGEKFGIKVEKLESDPFGNPGIYITNYEQFHKYESCNWSGIVLDESSILKSYTGKYRNEIIEAIKYIKFRLAATATPAPNDFMELGNHAEFVGSMTRTEMLSMFFIHDGGETQKWRLKGHAENEFWKWVASWAVMIRKPSDLGYDDGKFILPKLNNHQCTVYSEHPTDGFLFAMEALSLQERQKARKSTIDERVKKAAELVNASDEIWLIWCNLNDESTALKNAINGAVEVRGSDSDDHKRKSLIDFAHGKIKCLVSKVSIAGFGMNFQICHNMAFVGLSDSYEQFYQAVRRCWRFGQEKEVNAYVITSDLEGAVVKNIERKERDVEKMADEMVKHMASINQDNIKGLNRTMTEYSGFEDMIIPEWLKEIIK